MVYAIATLLLIIKLIIVNTAITYNHPTSPTSFYVWFCAQVSHSRPLGRYGACSSSRSASSRRPQARSCVMHAGPCSWFAEACLLGPRGRTAFPSILRDGGRKARRSNGRFRLNVSAGLWAGEEGGWRSLYHLRGLCCRRGLPAAGPLRHETVRRATGRGSRHVWPLAELGGRGPWQVFPQHPLLGPPQVSILGAEWGGPGAGNWGGSA